FKECAFAAPIGLIDSGRADGSGRALKNSRPIYSGGGRTFAGRVGVNRERVHAALKFRRQHLIDHAVTLDTPLAVERIRHDIHTEMCFSAISVAGMSRVLG